MTKCYNKNSRSKLTLSADRYKFIISAWFYKKILSARILGEIGDLLICVFQLMLLVHKLTHNPEVLTHADRPDASGLRPNLSLDLIRVNFQPKIPVSYTHLTLPTNREV